MKKNIPIATLLALAVFGARAADPVAATGVRVDTNGVLISPTNFFAANNVPTTGSPLFTNLASATATGPLSSNDWQNFNAKLAASFPSTGTVFRADSAATSLTAANLNPQQITLPLIAGTVANTLSAVVDTSLGNSFVVQATTNVLFDQPTNLIPGKEFSVEVIQDSTGNRSVTFNSNYWRTAGSIYQPATTNGGASDYVFGKVKNNGTNIATFQNGGF